MHLLEHLEHVLHLRFYCQCVYYHTARLVALARGRFDNRNRDAVLARRIAENAGTGPGDQGSATPGQSISRIAAGDHEQQIAS
jgi:hypothetical protein